MGIRRLDHNWRMAVVALVIYALDQISKVVVLRLLHFYEEKVVIEGFFKFVHWGNTGAAWSLFQGSNTLLTLVGVGAAVILVLTRHHFDVHTVTGQLSLGLILGGVMGNLTDRVRINHVVDFLYFYVIRRDGLEAGFPAFNLADMAICTGVGLLFLQSLKQETEPKVAAAEDKRMQG